jgi:DNA-binding response OmpR family regulator
MRLRAIVFDDEPLMRQLLWAVFDQRGYEVFSFPDPGVCPLHVAERCPCPGGTVCADVIISDLQMPDVNGLDSLESLIGKGCQRPHFAMTSGQWTETTASRARQIGCRLFAKPFHINDIIQWLGEVEPLIVQDRQLINWFEYKWLAQKAASSGQK